MKLLEMKQLAEEAGFSVCVLLDAGKLIVRKEVRDMCADNSCGKYGKCWSCPPACGSLEACREQIAGYAGGLLVQTIGEIEDSFDFESMMEIEAEHKAHFGELYKRLREKTTKVLALGAGCCTHCSRCTCPDEPCRFPQEMISSMEAYGLLVTEVCKASKVPYYYGPDRMAYTSCMLLKEENSPD